MESELKEKSTSISEGMRGIWRHAKRYQSTMLLLVVLGLISAVANGFVPYITGRFFDTLIALSRGESTGESFPLWGLLLVAWALTQLIANSIEWGMDRLRRKVDTSIHLAIQNDGFAHLFKLPLAYHTNTHINAVLSKISTAGWRISSIMQSVIQISPQLLSVLIGIVLAASINGLMASVLATGVFVYLIALVWMLRPLAAADSDAHEAWNEGWNDAAAAVQQVPSVKQAVAEEYEVQKTHNALMGRVFSMWYRLELIWNNISFFQRVIVFLTQLAIFILSVKFVANGTISVGELVALNGYALMFFGPFVSLGNSWQNIQNGLTAAGQLERIFTEDEEKYHPINAVASPEPRGEIVFNDVSLRYSAESPEVLSKIAFVATPGQKVALVGESGVGKSTVASLVSGYYFPSTGSVTVDGVDTRQWDLTELRKRIAVVPQEIALFNDTIRMNIRYGTFEASDAQVEHAAKEAHIDEFIISLPKKYETLVGERGIKLSVGQKQRIAIARAILRNPSILILDEPTSALDSQTEKFITTSLERLMAGRTTFIIAHRLSTVRKADKILVIKEGQVIEAGKHDELVTIEGGVYRHLYELHIGLHE